MIYVIHLGDNGRPRNVRLLSNPRLVLNIQNFYVEILFKYMIYRFGYQEAAMRFMNLIKNLLDQILLTNTARDIQIHQTLVQNIVAETEQSLRI